MDTDATEDDPVVIGPMRDFFSDRRLELVATKQTKDVLSLQSHQTTETEGNTKKNILDSNENNIPNYHINISFAGMTFKENEVSSNPLFEGTLLGMSIHTRDGQFLKVNSFFCKMLGYSAQELSDKNIKDIIDADAWQETVKILTQRNRGENRSTQKITRAIHKDGYMISILMNLAAILNDRGDVSSYLFQWMPTSSTGTPNDQIRYRQDDREELLKEIHHRVKNNLQVISSLLNLQARLVKDPKTADLFKISQDRIHSMALVHEKLYYSSNFKKVDFFDYIHSLFHSLKRTYYQAAKDITFDVNLEEINLPVYTAIPCGLILNELLSNAIKHAFIETEFEEKKIEISLRKINEGQIELKVRDNGVGMPKDFRLQQRESLGLSLVSFLAEDQLQGHLEVVPRKMGTEFRIQFRI